MGAPVAAYDRISDTDITIHSPVIAPAIVLVLDETLMDTIDVTKGLMADGTLIVNTASSKSEIEKKVEWKGKVVVIDASKIAAQYIGKPIPNTPMIGALLGATKMMPIKAFLDDTKHKLEKKFKSKPEVIDGNLKAISVAYEEVSK
jgi:pyruvate ferredoxin oxidoreductase gamma subunit